VSNRLTGEPLWPVEERPGRESGVPDEEAWPALPFPTKPPPLARQPFAEKDIDPHIREGGQAQMWAKFKRFRNQGLLHAAEPAGTGADREIAAARLEAVPPWRLRFASTVGGREYIAWCAAASDGNLHTETGKPPEPAAAGSDLASELPRKIAGGNKHYQYG